MSWDYDAVVLVVVLLMYSRYDNTIILQYQVLQYGHIVKVVCACVRVSMLAWVCATRVRARVPVSILEYRYGYCNTGIANTGTRTGRWHGINIMGCY